MENKISSKIEIMSWISEIFNQGIRRPGYPADIWVEKWIKQKFEEFNLDTVVFEPLQVQKWDAQNAKLLIWLEKTPQNIIEITYFFCKITNR